jgi:hypothetical protein
MRSMYSGNWYENCMTTPPPSEWPTTVARSTSSTPSKSRKMDAVAPSEWSPRWRCESPWPGRSGASTCMPRAASRSVTGAHVAEELVMPCTRSSVGRPSAPASR